jgi:hypothetical protein
MEGKGAGRRPWVLAEAWWVSMSSSSPMEGRERLHSVMQTRQPLTNTIQQTFTIATTTRRQKHRQGRRGCVASTATTRIATTTSIVTARTATTRNFPIVTTTSKSELRNVKLDSVEFVQQGLWRRGTAKDKKCDEDA